MTSWQKVLGAVPRDAFVPDTIWLRGEDGYMAPIERHDLPEKWRELCDADDAVVTQVDDGTEEYGIVPTSSSSAPSVMTLMLKALDPAPSMRVLEIGTGTGYNAAVLAERVGAANVTTIEIDPGIATHARAALQRAGYPVTVLTGDGTPGHPAGAPYDRVIVTGAVSKVPYAWVSQTRVDGRVVVPWTSTFPAGALLALTVRDGGTADGRFTEDVGFMLLRGQRRPPAVPWLHSDYETTTTRLCPYEPFDDDSAGSGAAFAVGVKLPGYQSGHTVDEDGAHTLRLSHPDSRSWASCTLGAHRHEVRQHGPRRLWDEFEAAYRWWVDAGRPDHTRFGMTVGPDGQRVWLDSPDNPVT